MGIKISKIQHPYYTNNLLDWQKWRRCYEGGRLFKTTYLERYSIKEDAKDWQRRLNITPIPRFAGAAIDEIANSITVRLPDVKRVGGSKSYLEACDGKEGGVDKEGLSMSAYLARNVLPPLLSLARVGVCIDREPVSERATYADGLRNTPYIYKYDAENIVSWDAQIVNNELYFKTLLLSENWQTYDTATGLPNGVELRYRRYWINDNGKVMVQFYVEDKEATKSLSDQSEVEYKEQGPPNELNLKTIPFVMYGLTASLMRDVADHQIALLNLESSEVSYGYQGNFPIYVEEADERQAMTHLKQATMEGKVDGVPNIDVGVSRGRRYPRGMNPPAFISPSGEPLLVSMKKSQQLKDDIRKLVGLTVSTLQPGHASAASKAASNQTIENGLAVIGNELEVGERKINRIWAEYMNEETSEISYPTTYALITQKDRIGLAKDMSELINSVPSKCFAKEASVQLAQILFQDSVSPETMSEMEEQIREANFITSDPDAIMNDLNLGLVSQVTASNARGYDGETEVPIANKEHAERAARIVTAQVGAKQQAGGDTGARGVKDLSADPQSADKEKQASQRTPDVNVEPGATTTRS